MQTLTIELSNFIRKSFEEIAPRGEYIHNWHVDKLAEELAKAFMLQRKRIIINMPPRYLKSICISVSFIAWILGKNPAAKIIVASYGHQIAEMLSLDTKRIMESAWYREIFPNTVIFDKQNSKRKFITTKNGFRYATSIGGSVTGEGADFLIVDDPHKPLETHSSYKRKQTIDWFENTFSSRLNNKTKGCIIVVMQRLHTNDLAGYLRKKPKVWSFVNLEAISTTRQIFRMTQIPIHKCRENYQIFRKVKSEIGEYNFESQYQQNPSSKNVGIIKQSWLVIDDSMEFNSECETFISIDSAIKNGPDNDHTAITFWKEQNGEYFLNTLVHEKFEFHELSTETIRLIETLKPTMTIIEDHASGSSLIQEIIRTNPDFKISKLRHGNNKISRLISCLHLFQNGKIKINPELNKLEECLFELENFPHIPHDDIVDSVTNFLNWHITEWKQLKDVQKHAKNKSGLIKLRMI